MRTSDFQSLLLRAAVVAMGVDGDVAEQEKKALAQVAASTAYFLGFDHVNALPSLLGDENNFGAAAPEILALAIQEGHLKPRQEEAMIEVLLRIIEADAVVHLTERELLRKLRNTWQMSDGVLLARFPQLLHYLMPDTGVPLHL